MQEEPTTREIMTAILDTRSALLETQAAVMDLHSAVSLGFARVDERFDRLEGRVGTLEVGMTAVRGEVAGLQRWMARSDERFKALEHPSTSS